MRKLALALVGAVVAFGLYTTPAIAVPAVPAECSSMTFDHIIVGTERSEDLDGTSGRDLIFGLGGSDDISGRGGNDCLVGGEGHDDLSGGAGNDVLLGENGADDASGGQGTDRCIAEDRSSCESL